MTEDEYRKYLKNYSSLKQSFDTEQIIKNIGLIFDVDVKNLKPHQENLGHLMTIQTLKFEEQQKQVFMTLEVVVQKKDYLILTIFFF